MRRSPCGEKGSDSTLFSEICEKAGHSENGCPAFPNPGTKQAERQKIRLELVHGKCFIL
jgi:hypothetical protein